MLAYSLCVFTIFSSVQSLIVCRHDGQEKVTCPDDFYCCQEDMCCKVFFPQDDDEEDDNIDSETMNSWLMAFGMRTFVVCMFMVLLVIIGKSVQYFRKYYLKPVVEENLPRYRPLDKNTVVSDVNNISFLIGTPLYQVDTETLSTFRNPGGLPF